MGNRAKRWAAEIASLIAEQLVAKTLARVLGDDRVFGLVADGWRSASWSRRVVELLKRGEYLSASDLHTGDAIDVVADVHEDLRLVFGAFKQVVQVPAQQSEFVLELADLRASKGEKLGVFGPLEVWIVET